ncbi:MAG: GNAT family N-acetyltransferase [bacterium]|nr:GNAT family N-acetyltransferase [bacterium]
MIDREIVLESDGVRLEPLQAHHLSAVARAGNDSALWEFTFGSNPFTNEADAECWFRDATCAPDTLCFAILDKRTGEIAGATRYLDIQPAHRKLEIGYTFLARRFWRTHVNTECKYLLMRYAFETWGAQRVQLKGEAINLRSRAAMERIGATYEGTLRAFRIKPESGAIRDTSFYSVIAPEWPAVKARLEGRIRDSRAAE